MHDLLIRDCHVVRCEPTETTVLRHHEVVIDAGLIHDILPMGTTPPESCKELIDARGMVAMPGLIDTHAHVPMVIFRGLAEDVSIEKWFNEYMWPLESNLQEDDVYWGMQLGLAELIGGGVTAVADHYFFMDRAAEAVQQAGVRAALGWAMFGSGGREGIERGARFAEAWNGKADGRITTWIAPHAPYTCDEPFLKEAAQEAGRLGLGVHIHASETAGQTEASLARYGRTPIQILEQAGVLEHRTIIAHGCGLTEADIGILARHRAGVACAPKTYMKLAMGTTPVLPLRNAGVPVGLATDGAVSNNTLDLWESMRLMAMVQKDRAGSPETMTIAEALHVATRGSAAVYGMPDKLGYLAPGYAADIILIDVSGTHCQPLHSIPATLVYATRASDVQTVIVAGRVVMRDRQLMTLDKAEIVRRVSDSMKRLQQRVPDNRIQLYAP